jgi:hypothetical protein
MSLRSVVPLLVAVCALGCGGSGGTKSNEPTTAKEKQRREAKANGDETSGSKSWGGWRYKGERTACFYSVGGRCFKTEAAACSVARCGKKKCMSTGGGPAIVSCR